MKKLLEYAESKLLHYSDSSYFIMSQLAQRMIILEVSKNILMFDNKISFEKRFMVTKDIECRLKKYFEIE